MKTLEEITASGRDPKNGQFIPTHGKTKTRLFNIWTGMKNRCYNPNKREFEKYGGRGITVCEAWLTDFMSFYNWAIANGYSEELSIDRIDNDKGYSPENCRWADKETQTLNRSVTKFIEINGQKYTVPQLAKIYGINKDCLYHRARKCGYTSEILKDQHKKYLFQGKMRELWEVAKITGISSSAALYRLKHGWTGEKFERAKGGTHANT